MAMDEKQEKQDKQDKRQARHERRIRNQIMAYTAVMLLIALAAIGVVFGVRLLAQRQKALQVAQQESQNALEDLLSSESDIPTLSSQPEETQESEPEPEPTPEEKLDELIDEMLAQMAIETKVAGLFIVTPESITGVGTAVKAGNGTKSALEKYAVGGIVYAAKNIKSEAQLKEMLETTKQYAVYPLFLAAEEEGGKRSVVANAGIGTKADAAQKLGEAGDTQAAYQAGAALGANLAGVGINLSFSPVADPATVEKSWLGERSYGGTGQITGVMASMAMQGLESQGVTACVKFFPGVGGTAENPEKGLAAVERTEEQFRQEEFPAFQEAVTSGARMIMVSSVAAPGLTGNNEPCLFSSRVVTDILRVEMGFDGVVISDSLAQAAISNYYGADEAAVMALRAGCDMLLNPENFDKAYKGILQAVQDGVVSEERINDALRRIYRIKYAGKLEE